jgi:hypothetical protein
MAGFQPFPIPRRIYTTSYFLYVPNNVSKRTVGLMFLSHSLIAFAFARYSLIRLVNLY